MPAIFLIQRQFQLLAASAHTLELSDAASANEIFTRELVLVLLRQILVGRTRSSPWNCSVQKVTLQFGKPSQQRRADAMTAVTGLRCKVLVTLAPTVVSVKSAEASALRALLAADGDNAVMQRVFEVALGR